MSDTLLNYRKDIDGLRALAVLLVIIFHAFPTILAGGFIGVDIFFVISGYLISGIILKALENNQFSYIDFYRRRIKRIFPSLILVLIACLIAGWFLLFSGEYASLGKNIASGAGFIANIIYWLESGYFDISSTLKPLIHLWSLGVEEQFYILWPILLVFIYKKIKRIPQTIFIILLISFFLNIYLGFKSPATAFYLPFTRFWELMGGALLAYFTILKGGLINNIAIRLKIKNMSDSFIYNTLSWLGIILIVLSAFIINDSNFHSGIVVMSIIGVILLIASGPQAWVNKNILSNKMLVFIGLISYPLYLWHWPLLSFATIINSGAVSTIVKLILIIFSFLFAWITYRLIEMPIRHTKIRNIPIILCCIMLLVGSGGILVYLNHGFDFRFPIQENALKTASERIDGKTLCKKLFPQSIYKLICFANGDGNNRVFIIGDSHTKSIYMGYSKILTERGYTVINIGIGACSLLDVKSMPVQQQKSCDINIRNVINTVLLGKPKAIIISNNAWSKNRDLFREGMDNILSYFPNNIKLIWFTQTPTIPFDLTKCIDRPLSSTQNKTTGCSFPRKSYDKMISGMNRRIDNLKKKYPQIINIDPSSVLCNQTECFITINNQFLYKDNNHLSLFGSQYLAEKIPIDQYFPIIMSKYPKE
ncbi:MAG: acyltransferase family protein [Candidatus Paceibacterota bacterium]|jgi:peptidoglycan/LPS O-acetylase OafA/YrhL